MINLSQTISVAGWTVTALVDDDYHLNVYVEAEYEQLQVVDVSERGPMPKVRKGTLERMVLPAAWVVRILADHDDPDAVLIQAINMDCKTIHQIDTGQGDGDGEQLAMRFTTPKIEQAYLHSLN